MTAYRRQVLTSIGNQTFSTLFRKPLYSKYNYNEGVWKYDGKNLINYRLKDEKINVQTMFIYKDNADIIWLGTENAGVYKFNGREFKKFKQ